jgi:hypothetical protein
MADPLFVSFFIDCESTQPAVNDPALGERASLGFAEVLESHDLRGTFHILPTDAEAHPALYRKLEARGHEIGLHVHPSVQGYGEFLGVYGPDDQRRIIDEAANRFAQAIGHRPDNICVGYCSINDHTFPILHDLGFRHGTNTIPTRVLPQCASVHAGAPLDVHYAHPFNRVLPGNLDLVNIPMTIDPDSRMWGGAHPLDLRVELVDAKNHWYTIEKSVKRQIAQAVPVKSIRGVTHNIFEFQNPADFRRQTLDAMLSHIKTIAEKHGLTYQPATGAQIARHYRSTVPIPVAAPALALDRRGYSSNNA